MSLEDSKSSSLPCRIAEYIPLVKVLSEPSNQGVESCNGCRFQSRLELAFSLNSELMERAQWSLPTIRYRSIVDVYPTKSRTDGGNLENREIVDYRRYDPIIIGVVSRDTWGDGISFQDLRVGLHELMVVAIGFREPAGGQYRVSSHDVHQYLLATS